MAIGKASFRSHDFRKIIGNCNEVVETEWSLLWVSQGSLQHLEGRQVNVVSVAVVYQHWVVQERPHIGCKHVWLYFGN